MIRGHFDPAYPWPMPTVQVDILVPGFMGRWATVSFLVDTGASTTCLHPHDAMSVLRLKADRLADPVLWPVQEPYFGVGGASVSYVVPVRYLFRHEDGQEQMLRGDLRIAQLTRANEMLPSLLGWDVLQHFELVTNWRDRRVTLESV